MALTQLGAIVELLEGLVQRLTAEVAATPPGPLLGRVRSEERRVGKECRL